MGQNSNIQWTHHTFNPWRGCTKVSEGCAHCYAEKMSVRNPKVLSVWGPKGTRAIAAESYWKQPIAWNWAAKEAGERHRVFCASLADVFEGFDTLPESSAQPVTKARLRLFDLIEATPHLNWLLLTKRPENVEPILSGAAISGCRLARSWSRGKPPANVWLGTSVEDQPNADKRIPALLECPAAIRFLSIEPQIGPIDLECYPSTGCPTEWLDRKPGIDWVIQGGESGLDARPFDIQWARDLRGCRAFPEGGDK